MSQRKWKLLTSNEGKGQDTEERAVVRQTHSLSRKYFRLSKSHPAKKWGESVSGRRNGMCEGPKAD